MNKKQRLIEFNKIREKIIEAKEAAYEEIENAESCQPLGFGTFKYNYIHRMDVIEIVRELAYQSIAAVSKSLDVER